MISREISFQDNEESGTDVVFGDQQLVPVGDGLLYVRPFYVAIEGITEYRFVIVSYENRATFASTLTEALADLFPGFDGEIAERVASADDGDVTEPVERPDTGDGTDSGDAGDPGDSGDEPGLVVPDTPDERATTAELLLQAEALFAEADQLLRDGDLGAYQDTIARAEQFVQAAIDSLQPND